KVYGWCNNPKGYVMDHVPGEPHFENVTDDQRRQVMRDYMKLLAEMHKLPVQPFKDAGIIHAKTPEGAHLVGQHYMTAVFRRIKVRPDPFVEFALGWLDRHPLAPPCRES